MKLMLDIAYDYLNEGEPKTFQNIFKVVKNELKGQWKEANPKFLLTQIDGKKMGELYTHLTLDGRFIMIDNNNWTTTKMLTSDQLRSAKSKSLLSEVDEL